MPLADQSILVGTALCDRAGYPLLGVIDLPLMDARYFAVRGQGTWLNDRYITVSNATDLGKALTMLANQNGFAGAASGCFGFIGPRVT